MCAWSAGCPQERNHGNFAILVCLSGAPYHPLGDDADTIDAMMSSLKGCIGGVEEDGMKTHVYKCSMAQLQARMVRHKQ